MNRVSLGLKNTKISFFFYFALLILAFFSRKIFIEQLGVDFVGLSSLMINVFNIINLSELGIGTAIATAIYKPLYNNSRDEISDIISVLGYIYRIVGFVIIGIGLLILISIPFIIDGDEISVGWYATAFAAFFLLNLVPYFISYQQVLLTADQRQYEVTASTNIFIIIKILGQIALLKLFDLGYVAWLLMEVAFAFVLGLWLIFRVKRIYPWLEVSINKGKQIRKHYSHIFKTARQVVPHRVANSVLMQTDTLIIWVLLSVQSITYFTNYAMLMNRSVALVATSFSGLMAGVGNLIAQGNTESVKKLFWEFNAIFLSVGAVFAIGIYYIASPFISLWLGDEFLLDNWIVLFLALNTFLSIIRIPLAYFINGYSLFKDTWAPICEIFINLLLSFALGYLYGMVGVMIGTAVSLFFMFVWKPYFFYREIFKQSVWTYWMELAKYFISIALALGVIYFLFIKNNLYMPLDTYLGLIVNSIAIFLLVVSVMTSSLYFISGGMRDVLSRFIKIILKR